MEMKSPISSSFMSQVMNNRDFVTSDSLQSYEVLCRTPSMGSIFECGVFLSLLIHSNVVP